MDQRPELRPRQRLQLNADTLAGYLKLMSEATQLGKWFWGISLANLLILGVVILFLFSLRAALAAHASELSPDDSVATPAASPYA